MDIRKLLNNDDEDVEGNEEKSIMSSLINVHDTRKQGKRYWNSDATDTGTTLASPQAQEQVSTSPCSSSGVNVMPQFTPNLSRHHSAPRPANPNLVKLNHSHEFFKNSYGHNYSGYPQKVHHMTNYPQGTQFGLTSNQPYYEYGSKFGVGSSGQFFGTAVQEHGNRPILSPSTTATTSSADFGSGSRRSSFSDGYRSHATDGNQNLKQPTLIPLSHSTTSYSQDPYTIQSSHYVPRDLNDALSSNEISRLFEAARNGKNVMKVKRDTAMLCFLLDLKMSSQKIADLQYRDIKGMVDGSFRGVYVYNRSNEVIKHIECHERTASSVREWIAECKTQYEWEYEDNSPVFVPLAFLGVDRKPIRQPLKRDAVSKVFGSLKSASGVWLSRDLIQNSALQ
ncbi:hypothetical protein MP638_003855 [Amoeboaphelidium occidentale]|nr:hypothetical protein MP638_003855 [Amoeboaphelidium occidentale]